MGYRNRQRQREHHNKDKDVSNLVQQRLLLPGGCLLIHTSPTDTSSWIKDPPICPHEVRSQNFLWQSVSSLLINKTHSFFNRNLVLQWLGQSDNIEIEAFYSQSFFMKTEMNGIILTHCSDVFISLSKLNIFQRVGKNYQVDIVWSNRAISSLSLPFWL